MNNLQYQLQTNFKINNMKTIIAATDFSVSASNAARYAAEMAVAIHADLLLLHLYQLPLPVSEIPVVTDPDEDIRKADEALASLQEELIKRTSGKIRIDTKTEVNTFFGGLKSACDKLKPYAVVLGSQGTTAAERLLLGGHTVYAMKHLEWPLITVPKDAVFKGIKRIGLACDLHNVPEVVPVDELVSLVNDFGAELHVLNTGRQGKYDPKLVFQSSTLSKLTGEIEPQFHFLTADDTDKAIIEFANKEKIDLLIILPRRHTLLHNLTHRSNTKLFVLHSFVPVAALHKTKA